MNAIDLLTLLSTPKLGSSRARALVARFGSCERAFHASERELIRVPGIDTVLAKQYREYFRHHLPAAHAKAEKECNDARKHNATIITWWDEQYPETLKEIFDAPLLLYVKGELPAPSHNVAVIGTRKPSEYGKRHARNFTLELARAGITITSGLARGIDAIAHRATLEAHGATIAVLGSGIDVMYPIEHKKLAEQIASEGGAVITEFPLGAAPDAVNFPRRNRIVSGLSQGVLVVESDAGGGSMITAALALDQNRDVFAIPGDVERATSKGTNRLISSSRAKLVSSAADVFEALGIATNASVRKAEAPAFSLTKTEEKIYSLFSDELAIHIDDIADRTKMSTSDVNVTLLSMEMKNAIRQMAGKMFSKM